MRDMAAVRTLVRVLAATRARLGWYYYYQAMIILTIIIITIISSMILLRLMLSLTRTGGFDCAKKHRGHSLAPPVVQQNPK